MQVRDRGIIHMTMIDMNPSIVEGLRTLLTQLDEQLTHLQHDKAGGAFLYDTEQTYQDNSDPIEMEILDMNVLKLARSLKEKLHL